MDLNQEIKEGLILPLAREKITMTIESEIHNTDFLISPTTHLFPLVGQSGSHGVSIKINLKPQDIEYGNDYKSKYTTLDIRTMLD